MAGNCQTHLLGSRPPKPPVTSAHRRPFSFHRLLPVNKSPVTSLTRQPPAIASTLVFAHSPRSPFHHFQLGRVHGHAPLGQSTSAHARIAHLHDGVRMEVLICSTSAVEAWSYICGSISCAFHHEKLPELLLDNGVGLDFSTWPIE